MAKVMLVEDDNNLREIYEARLQAEGYTIVSAHDGEEALVVAKAEKPDLIISDVMMPKISGFEMLDILRNTPGLKEVKVIMLTALGQNDDQQRASKLGADRYLVKSQVTLEDIVKVTHDLLNDQPAEGAAPSDAPAADAVAADPVQAAPAADAPAPEPAAAPAADAPSAQSEAQEEANVEAKIENFVAGASEEPTSPAADAPAPEPAAAPAPEPPTVAPAAEATSNQMADDKLLDNAVQQIEDSAEKSANGSGAAAPPVPAPSAVQPAPPPAPEPQANQAQRPGSVPIAHKKIIEPIDSAPKKDIEQLLALEDAKEAQGGGSDAPATQPVVSDSSQKTDDNVDPHSIAL